MALPINIEDLLGGLVVESNRVEYKKGWNPDPIYRTICAFANDFDDTSGGYIVVGVDEVDGRAVRPVEGIDINEIEPIEKAMVGFNNLIAPYYQPRVFFEPVDGKIVMVIWVTAGERRPYKVPDMVTAREKKYNYYIRYNSSSIVAKELRMDEKGHILPVGEVWETDVTDFGYDNEGVIKNDTDVTENVTEKSTAEKRRDEILRLMKLDKKITTDNLANILHVSRRTIARDIGLIRSQDRLLREGSDYGGHWIVIEESK